ncbi:MAG: class I SAM-dependent methyltransferase [Catenulispora sp.]|nr:class I SAM-dependent methyltransferase [Catenulispora sp.]
MTTSGPTGELTSEPMPSGHKPFDRLAGEYDSLRGGSDRGRQAAAQLHPRFAPGAVLEIGTGTGAVLAGLAELGRPVYGLDLNAAMLDKARDRLAGHLLLANAQALPIADGSVDNVLFAHALHLVGDMGNAVREAARALRPGGRLVALHGEPFADSDDVVAALAPLDELKPARPDTVAGLTAAAEAAGLEPVDSDRVAEYVSEVKPAAFVDMVATRQPPFLWHVPDEDWQRVVEPVLAALRTLPEPERPRAQRWHTLATVFVKPLAAAA